MPVKAKNYNPPKRERILEWQKRQEFPICPNPEDPDSANVYKHLRFPDEIHERIGESWEEKAEALENQRSSRACRREQLTLGPS